MAAAAAGFSFPLVVDPVMVSKHGLPLVAEEARGALVAKLLPRAFLVTPNVPEAAALAGHGDSRRGGNAQGRRAAFTKWAPAPCW